MKNENILLTLTIEAKTWRERLKMVWEILTTGKVVSRISRENLVKEGIIK